MFGIDNYTREDFDWFEVVRYADSSVGLKPEEWEGLKEFGTNWNTCMTSLVQVKRGVGNEPQHHYVKYLGERLFDAIYERNMDELIISMKSIQNKITDLQH